MSVKQMSLPGSHDYICDLMKDRPAGSLLDSPCGAGALSQRLSKMGHRVSCCDIDSGNFHGHDDFELSLADFNSDPLSYPDRHFDYVVCANGLHRLFYPNNLLSEFRRVMKEDGTLILSWPNYNSLARRLKFLVTGNIGGSIDFASHDQTLAEPAANVRFPLSTSRVEHLLRPLGLQMTSIACTGYRLYDYLLSPLAAVVWLLAKLTRVGRRDNSFAVLRGGSTTIVTCTLNRD